MSLYGSVYRRALWPAYEIVRGRHTWRLLRDAEKRQWCSPAELRSFQTAELQTLLRHTYGHSAWHRQRFLAAGLSPDEITSLADLPRLPLLTKDDFHQHREQMLADDSRGHCFLHKTGGSTGVPVQFYISHDSNEWRNAMTMRGYGWAGAHDAEKLFFLWSIPVDNPPLVKRLKVRLHDALLRRRFFNNFTLSKSTLPICLDALNRYAPRVLIGYTSMLEYLARHVQKHGGLKVRLHSVLAAAEALSQSQRELLHEAFRAPVFASYGSREFKLIAMECENQSLHLSADNLLVEVLHQGKPATAGQLGEVVITDLHNFATPFIRYEIGDIATPGPQSCPCGRGLPVIGAVHGRIPDTIQTPDGRLITGIFFPHLLKEFDWIVQFQVVQKELDRLSISLVVSDQPLAERELPRVQEAILEVLGSGVSLQFAFCSEIPRTATGKHRAVVSEIPVQI